MQRVFLFVLTNLAVMLVLAGVVQMFGVERILDERGVGLDLRSLLLMSLVFGMGGSFVSLALSKWMARRLTGARVIEQPETPVEVWLLETVRQQARAHGIGMPEVAIFDSDQPNAFATGARRDHALVAVSRGLLQGMRRDEVEAVLAHEVSHVANGDMVTLTLIQGVVNSFVIALSRVAGWAVDRLVLRNEEGHGPAYFATSLLAQLVFGLLASPIVFWFSRQREYRADAGAARLVGARPMIAALERLRAAGPSALPAEMSAFGISGGGFARWFSTHPSIDERIAALRCASGI
ncbi:MAG TPA: protease HtpX [Myxococcota bacterium]|jgi:heat shock protein HtpX